MPGAPGARHLRRGVLVACERQEMATDHQTFVLFKTQRPSNSPSSRIPSTMRRFTGYLPHMEESLFSIHQFIPKTNVSTALDITKEAYETFGRGDIPAF
jgi:hypothetical protein